MIKLSERIQLFFFWGIILEIFILAGQFFWTARPLVDEQSHYLQTLLVLGHKTLWPQLVPTLPGYHWTLAFLCWITHNSSGEIMRFFSSSLSLLCLYVFFLLAKKIDKNSAMIKTALLFFLPLIFPFWFLLYTDAYSMLLIFASLLCILDRRFWWAGFFGGLSFLVRQNNLVWVAMIAGIGFLESSIALKSWDDFKFWSKKLFVYIVVFEIAILFFVWNQGLVLGDKDNHPLIFSLENTFVFLFLFFFIFLPYHVRAIKKGWGLLWQKKTFVIALVISFIAYFFFFKVRNFYNSPIIFKFFLHNRLLGLMTLNPTVKALCFLPILGSLLAIIGTPLKQRSFYLLYPFTLLFLILLFHVEPRYGFIPLTLFLLFKESDSLQEDLITLALYIPAAIFLMMGIRAESFFL